MAELSTETKNLIQKYQEWQKSLQPKAEESTIHVDEVASTVAAFYEKIRGVVEWREEHLIRRAAIERNLKRRLLFRNGKTTGKEIAEPLVLELIRGGHFPNDRIPESKITQVQKILTKYNYVLETAPAQKEKLKSQLYDWILSIAACEIEETLSPPIREKALINYMTQLMKESIEIQEGAINLNAVPEEKKKFTFILPCKNRFLSSTPLSSLTIS